MNHMNDLTFPLVIVLIINIVYCVPKQRGVKKSLTLNFCVSDKGHLCLPPPLLKTLVI